MHCLIRWLVSHAKKVAFLLVLTRPDYLVNANMPYSPNGVTTTAWGSGGEVAAVEILLHM